MSKFRKCLIMGVVLIMCIGVFTACNDDGFDNKYNAVLYDSMVDYLNEDYLAENSTKGSEYLGSYIENDTRPATKIKIIQNEEEFNVAFKEFPIDIDFENEMLIVYLFTGHPEVNSNNTIRFYKYSINDMSFNDSKLKVFIKREYMISDDAPRALPPTQVCLVIKMCILDIEEKNIEITFKR